MCENEHFIDSSAAAEQSCPNTSMTKSIGWLCGTLRHVFVPPNCSYVRGQKKRSSGFSQLSAKERSEIPQNVCFFFLTLET